MKIRIALLALAAACSSASAQLVFDLDYAYSNQGPGQAGYRQDFGDVLLSLEDKNKDGFNDIRFEVNINDVGGVDRSVKLGGFYFNISPFSQGFSLISTNVTSVNFKSNSYKAGPSAQFDAKLGFKTSGAGVNSTVFWLTKPNTALTLDYVFNDANPSLTATAENQKGWFTFAAHVQSTNTQSGSEWVGARLPRPELEPAVVIVPEPAHIGAVAAILLLGLAFWRRRS